MKLKIFVDTSVLGGCFDDEFKEWSNKLVNEIKDELKIAVISDLTLRELEDAPFEVRENVTNIPEKSKNYVLLDDEARYLAEKYIDENAIGRKHLVDAQQIAIATINKVDILVSWNFKHIVNFNRIRLYNATNLKYGYQILEIRTPREILNEVIYEEV
jgi:hypothetical protein